MASEVNANTLNLVIPGDTVTLEGDSNISLGPNIKFQESTKTLQSISAGLFIQQPNKKDDTTLYYVDSARGRYIPSVGDLVLGTVIGKFGDFYRIMLNEFSENVILNIFAFPNASKKNRPILQIRDLVYARVSACSKSVDVELSCIDPVTGKDGGFGVLHDGYCFNVSTAYARYLLFSHNATILKKLVEKVQFEIAIGINGKIWVKSADPKSTMLCVHVLSESQNWKSSEINENFDRIIRKFKKL